MNMGLEAIILGVSDVDRAKAFYEKLRWRLDIDRNMFGTHSTCSAIARTRGQNLPLLR